MKEKTCQRCGRKMAADAPEGICPSCLMEANLGTEATGIATGGKTGAMPVEAVAKHSPDLEVVELIGSGGMGAVYKARQSKLNRLVALKILRRDERDLNFVERFTREAQTLARLNHPNIVAVYDFGEREGLFFLIMELVDGATLRQLLGEGKMKPEAALAIVPPICEALQYAHEKGVVHRDIKPENILVDKEGRVKVADFGIARLAGTDAGRANLTGEGQVVGTAHYMAPEQVERPASVDHRADIYALGVVFYEMLTGELPLGKFPEPSKRVQVDVRLDEVVLKALEKEPGRRYQTAVEMCTGVETVSESCAEGVKGAGVQAAESDTIRRIRRSLLWYGLGGSLFGVVAGIAMNLPVIWGLSLFGIAVGLWKLGLSKHAEAAGTQSGGARARPVVGRGIRKRSEREIFGWPLWSVAMGPDVSRGEMRGHARGIFAFGDMATGWFAAGGIARGGVALGGVAIGVIFFGGAAIGLVGAFGHLAVAVLIAAGGGAVGYYAAGVGTLRVHDLAELAGWHEAVSVPENGEEFLAVFPNGVSVEVAAVCRDPRNSEVWWRPDGTLLPEGTVKVVSGLEEERLLARIRAGKSWFGVGKTSENTPENEVLIYVRRVYPEGWPDDLHGWMLGWSRPPSRMEVRRFPNVRWLGGEIGSGELLWFDEVPDELDLTVTLPMGPWEPVAIFDGRETRGLLSGVKAEFRRGGEEDHKDLLFEISHNLDFREYGLRVMARMRDGSSRQVFEQSTGENPGGGFRTYLTFSGNPGLKLEEVEVFELARTTLAVRRIEGIRLAPKAVPGTASGSAVIPAAVDEYSLLETDAAGEGKRADAVERLWERFAGGQSEEGFLPDGLIRWRGRS